MWVAGLASQGPVPDRLFVELERAGLACTALVKEPSPCGPGIVCFECCDPHLLERVRTLSRGGEERLLALDLRQTDGDRGDGWAILAAGAADVLGLDAPERIASAAAARFLRWAAVDRLLDSRLVHRNLVGTGPAWRATLRRVVEIARFSGSSILLGGESGTGKELVARLIHTLDGRPDKRELIIVDCTTVAPGLSGSEFFGHDRGAYTGASGPRDGAFALADGGTLFLDEVGELPLRLQGELLRVVQEGTYKRLGGDTWQTTRFRLVCATHRNLPDEVAEGRFRADLYHRLAAWTCVLPPLRERREDVPALAERFLTELFGEASPPPLDPAVLDLLLARDYPGNVRDLKHLVERIAARHVGDGPITFGDVPEDERPAAAGAPRGGAGELFERSARRALLGGMGLKEIGNAAAEAAVRVALEREEGNVHRAALLLGVTDRALQLRRAAWRKKGGDGVDEATPAGG